MWEYRDPEELYHWGVLGMRWGHRKARYNKVGNRRKRTSKDYRKAQYIKKKNVKQMSNKELDFVNNRLNKENLYRENRTKNVLKAAVVAGSVATIIGNMDKIYENGSKMIDHSSKLIKAGKNFVSRFK